MGGRSKTKPGYSLVEVTVTLAILVLLVTISAMVVASFKTNSVRTHIDMLYQTCLYLKHHALMTGTDQLLTFDLAHNKYTYHNQTHSLPSTIIFGTIAGALGPPSHPQHPITEPCTFKKNQITFYKDGNVDAGSIYITDSGHQQLGALTISVAEYSYIRRYIYRNGWKLW